MDCARSEELLSDHLDGALAEPLLGELERHLAECEACRALRGALGDVVAALRATVPALDPPAGLDLRAAAAALAAARRAAAVDVTAVAAAARPRMPLWLQAVAATVAVAMGAGVVAARRTLGSPGEIGSQLAERTNNAGSYLTERKERLVEDIHLLRVMVETAFEGRLDRIGERVDDYRRLLERRRALEQRGAPGQDQAPEVQEESRREFPNRGRHARVPLDERAPQAPSGPPAARLPSRLG